MQAAFSGIVDDPSMKYKDLVVSQLAKARGQELSRSKLLKINWNKFDGDVLDRILRNLTDAGMLDTYTKKNPKRGVSIMYRLVDSGM